MHIYGFDQHGLVRTGAWFLGALRIVLGLNLAWVCRMHVDTLCTVLRLML